MSLRQVVFLGGGIYLAAERRGACGAETAAGHFEGIFSQIAYDKLILYY